MILHTVTVAIHQVVWKSTSVYGDVCVVVAKYMNEYERRHTHLYLNLQSDLCALVTLWDFGTMGLGSFRAHLGFFGHAGATFFFRIPCLASVFFAIFDTILVVVLAAFSIFFALELDFLEAAFLKDSPCEIAVFVGRGAQETL